MDISTAFETARLVAAISAALSGQANEPPPPPPPPVVLPAPAHTLPGWLDPIDEAPFVTPALHGDDNGDGRVDEDESGWNCRFYGNKVCGTGYIAPDGSREVIDFTDPTPVVRVIPPPPELVVVLPVPGPVVDYYPDEPPAPVETAEPGDYTESGNDEIDTAVAQDERTANGSLIVRDENGRLRGVISIDSPTHPDYVAPEPEPADDHGVSDGGLEVTVDGEV